MDLSKFKVTNLARVRCISCHAELTRLTLDTNKVDHVLVCSNPKCARVGLLTVIYAKLEAKEKQGETKKSRHKRVSKKSV